MHLDAARLALLALRASVAKDKSLRPGVRIFPNLEVLTPDEATKFLLGTPKPVACSAHPTTDVLTIACSTIELHTADFRRQARTAELARREGGFMPYLIERYRATSVDPIVYCCGRDEAIVVPLSAVNRWAEDYLVRNVIYRGDDAANELCADWPQYHEAQSRGAAGILIFSSPADDPVVFLALEFVKPPN